MHTRMAKTVDLAKIHEKIFKGEESLSESLSSITTKIDALKMDIKQLKYDITGESYYVIIHTAGESFFPRCSIFSKSQLDFLKQVLTGIVLSNEGFIGKIQAINSCQALTKSDAQDTLHQFVKEKILMEVNGGTLCLSPLAVVEFEPYFNTCFSGNLSICDLCRQLVFVGRSCDGCSQKFHNHCATTWVTSKHTECPKCSQEWTVLS